MGIQLEQPLIFFDLETTGTNPAKDKIVELSAIKLLPGGGRDEILRKFNPGIPIPKGASDVHGITNEDVAFEPHFTDVAETIYEFFKGADVGGYNIIRFDLPLLVEELLRAGIQNPLTNIKIVDAMSIFHKKEPRNLAGALRFYCNEELINAHSAKADVEATIKVFEAQFDKYQDIGSNVEEVHEFSMFGREMVDFGRFFIKDASGDVVFNFGKNKGKKVAEDKGYLEWMLKSDFPLHTKMVAKELLAQ